MKARRHYSRQLEVALEELRGFPVPCVGEKALAVRHPADRLIKAVSPSEHLFPDVYVIDEKRLLVTQWIKHEKFVAEIHDRATWAAIEKQNECYHDPRYGEYDEREYWFKILDFIASGKMELKL